MDLVVERDSAGRVLNKYKKGRMLGKGGFARCYHVTNTATGTEHAAKVVDKRSLKPKTQAKLQTEIQIHAGLNHPNVVQFQSHFEDDVYVYIILELCPQQTLMELQSRKVRLSETEARYLLFRTITGLKYMHDRNVIHRDLKLGNIMLGENMEPKIGDFGLAAQLEWDGERKRTICGTPNYIAPEVLTGAQAGHSFEVDVWSVGVILFTMLCGKPPFQTHDVRATYTKIKNLSYHFPADVTISTEARSLVQRILQNCPSSRPGLDAILRDPFFTKSEIPKIPPSSLWPAGSSGSRKRLKLEPGPPAAAAKKREALKPLTNISPLPTTGTLPADQRNVPLPPVRRSSSPSLRRVPSSGNTAPTTGAPACTAGNQAALPGHVPGHMVPKVWVSEYSDFTAKYGMAYKLSCGYFGAAYNDGTKLVWHCSTAGGDVVDYINRIKDKKDGQTIRSREEHTRCKIDDYPETLQKKITLIKYFQTYFGKYKGRQDVSCKVVTANSNDCPLPLEANPPGGPIVFVKQWLKTERAMVFRLSNKAIQVAFFDGCDIVLSSEAKVVLFTDGRGCSKSFLLESGNIPDHDIAERLDYTHSVLSQIAER